MSKFIPLLFAGAGAAATAIGGAYLIKNSGSGSSDQVRRNDEVEEGNSPEKNSPALEFDTLQKFKNGKGGGCVQDLFGQSPEIDFNVAEGTNPSESNFFGVVPTDTADNTKSCLVINWKKTLGGAQDDNGKGTFTWTGAFVNGNKGFVTFNVAKTHESEKKLELIGGFYLLEKITTETPNKGTIKGKKEVESGKELTASNFEQKFPKAKGGSAFQLSELTNKDYGDFVDGKDKLNRISGDISTPSIPNPLFRRGSWSWQKSGGSNKVGEGSEDFEWGNYIYDKNTFDLSLNLTSFSGTGTLDVTRTQQGSQ